MWISLSQLNANVRQTDGADRRMNKRTDGRSATVNGDAKWRDTTISYEPTNIPEQT